MKLGGPYKTGWIIVGPESSGSKFIAKYIASIHDINDWDGSFIVSNNKSVVYHRSCPFGRPRNYASRIIQEINEIRSVCTELNVVFTTRDKTISEASKSIRFGYQSAHVSEQDVEQLHHLYDYLKSYSCKIFVWNYETMCLLGKSYFDVLNNFFGITTSDLPSVIDGNKKFLADTELIQDGGRNVQMIYNINIYRRDEEQKLCRTQARALECLNAAIRKSINRKIRIVVSTNERDYDYLKNLLHGNNRYEVRLLGRDSLTKKKPYIRDILLHNNYANDRKPTSNKYVYCAYANSDICVPSYFFEFIFQQLYWMAKSELQIGNINNSIVDSLVINRRDIEGDEIYWHPGSDLFIFPAKWLKTMNFGDVSIGLPPIGPMIWLNILYHSRRTIQISDLFITAHHGREECWRSVTYSEETKENYSHAASAFKTLIKHDVEHLKRFNMKNHIHLNQERLESLIAEWSKGLAV